MPEHNNYSYSKYGKKWDERIYPGQYTTGGLLKCSNLSKGYHGILKQYWEYYNKGKDVLLISENNVVRDEFKQLYPSWNIKTLDNYPEISSVKNDVDIVGDICSRKKDWCVEKFDLIINQATLEHVYDPFQAMLNLTGALNTNGILVTHTHPPNQEYHQYPRDYFRFMIDWWIDLPNHVDDIELLEVCMKNNAHVFTCYRKLNNLKINFLSGYTVIKH